MDTFANQPQTGTFEFGIGAGSESLGTVRIGQCRYVANDDGAYGGFFPTLEDWTKMEFTGTQDAFIWVKTPDQSLSNPGTRGVEATGCFEQKNGAGDFVNFTPTWNDTLKKFDWGADIRWKPGATSPAKPGATPGVGNVAGPTPGGQGNRRSRRSLLDFLRDFLRRRTNS